MNEHDHRLEKPGLSSLEFQALPLGLWSSLMALERVCLNPRAGLHKHVAQIAINIFVYGAFGGIMALLLWIVLSSCTFIFGVCISAVQAAARLSLPETAITN